MLCQGDDARADLAPSQTVDLEFTLSRIDADEVVFFVFGIVGYYPMEVW